MKAMHVLWRRLVKEGNTCVRCGSTGRELEAAVSKLAAVLQPLGIAPVLETQDIDETAFKADPAESNRVWIEGKPIEEWLDANVGMSRCCSVCGDSDCRTLEVGGRSYETIPEEQFIKAGLMAASQMMAPTTSPCCSAAAEGAPCSPAAAEGKCGQ